MSFARTYRPRKPTAKQLTKDRRENIPMNNIFPIIEHYDIVLKKEIYSG